jgi:hypothetical protein
VIQAAAQGTAMIAGGHIDLQGTAARATSGHRSKKLIVAVLILSSQRAARARTPAPLVVLVR